MCELPPQAQMGETRKGVRVCEREERERVSTILWFSQIYSLISDALLIIEIHVVSKLWMSLLV